MAVVSMKALLESGVHFGHQTRRWNPKMSQFIFTARNGIHIIDLQKTMQRVKVAYSAMRDLSSNGGKVLFVGTKKQAQSAIVEYAEKCGMYYVSERWLGGLLTNFKTVNNSIQRLKELERMQENDSWDAETKKEILELQRELGKKNKILSGIKNMATLPDALFIIDPKRETIAVQEAQKLGIPIFAVVDTNCNPDDIDYPIPGNDDAIRAIALFLEVMAKAIVEGQSGGQSSDIAFDDEDGASAPAAAEAVEDEAEVKAAPKEKEAVLEEPKADQW
ncbi:MAG TPA: 30S ribosomal protein S2 [Spirochaetota bacterium]|nr:30S ribosomal protein S2 [Spirochaetota bacterium]